MSGTTRDDTHDTEDDLLAEVVEKASVGVVAFGVERALLVAFSFVVTALSGAVVYGYLSVFVRGETVVKNLVAGIGDGYSRTMARATPSARKSVVTAGFVGILATWAVLAGAIVWFRDSLIAVTLLEPRHRSTLLLYALGLLPFVSLRNARDVFRAVRAIRTATLVAHVFRPAALLLGALVGTVVLSADDAVAALWTSVVGATVVAGTVATGLVVRRTGVTLARHRAVLGDFFRYVVTASGVAILELVQRRAVFVVMAVVLGPVEAGLFSLSVVFGQLVRWPLSGVNTILPPIVARLYDAGRGSSLKGLYQRTARLATVAATPVVLLLVPYHRELLALFSPAYADAAVVLLLVVIGQYLATTFGSVGLVLLMTDNERASLALQVLNAAVALPIILVLTVRFGVVGLALAYLVAVLFNNATECCLLYVRDGFLPFTRAQLLSVGTGFAGLATTAVATARLATLPGLTVTGVVVIGYLGVVWSTVLSDADKAVVTAALGSVVSPSRSP